MRLYTTLPTTLSLPHHGIGSRWRLQCQVRNSVVLDTHFSSNASRCIPPANLNPDSSAKTTDTPQSPRPQTIYTSNRIEHGFLPNLQHPKRDHGSYQIYL